MEDFQLADRRIFIGTRFTGINQVLVEAIGDFR